MERTIAVIQARVNSSRLPGKVLADVHGSPLIAHVVDRVRQCERLDGFVLATGEHPANLPLIELCGREDWPLCVGPDDDVLARYQMAAEWAGADVIVRITGDCPLHSPSEMAAVIAFRRANAYAYASNIHPPRLPDGLDCEVFTRQALELAHERATKASDREHVTPWLRANLPIDQWGSLSYWRDYSHYRLTVDEPQDLELMRRLMVMGGPDLTWQRAVMLMRAHPALEAVNRGILRNEGYQRSLAKETA